MGGNEIERNLVGRTVLNETSTHAAALLPAADSKPGIHALNRTRGVVIQLPVGCLFWLSCQKSMLARSNFEVPAGNFVEAVAAIKCMTKALIKPSHFHNLSAGNIRLVPERMHSGRARAGLA